MAIGVTLKLKDSADYQDFSSTDENYLAYRAGLQYANYDSAEFGSLGFLSSGDTNTDRLVGTFANTEYNNAVGVGANPDASTFLFSTTLSNIYQTKSELVGPTLDSDHRLPIYQYDSDGQKIIREFNDSDQVALGIKLNTRIFTSDYPGSYKLASSAPSGDYAVALSDVITDTRTDGHSLQYNIYQRKTMTPPTQVLPFSIKRSNGDSGDYEGLQLMNERQVDKSMEAFAKDAIRRQISSPEFYPIGSYLILNSLQGTPTSMGYSGTWSSKGTATDTRQALDPTNYSGTRVSTYSRLIQSNYSADYTRTRSSVYSLDYSRARTSTYSANYTKTRTSNYSLGFVGNYIGNYTRTSTRDSQRGRVSTLDYVGNYTGDFVGNYARLLYYTGNFTGNYVGASIDTFTVTTGRYITDDGGDPPQDINNYGYSVFDAIGGVSNNQVSFLGNATLNAVYTESYPAGSPDFYLYVDVTGTFNSNALASVTIVNPDTGVTWIMPVGTGGSTTVVNGITFYRYAQNISGRTLWSWFSTVASTDILGVNVGDVGRVSNITLTAGTLATTPTTDFTRTSTRTSTATGTYTRNSTQDFLGNYTRNVSYLGNYAGDFLGEYSADYSRATPDNFARDFIGNYARAYNRTRSSTYARTTTTDYVGNYSRDFTGDFLGNFTGNYVGTASYTNSGPFYDPATPNRYWVQEWNEYPSGTEVQQSWVWNNTEVYVTSAYTSHLDTTPIVSGYRYRKGELQDVQFDVGNSRFLYYYAISYEAVGTADYTRTSTRTSLRSSIGDFTRTRSSNFVGNYSRNFVGNYSRNFTRTRSSNFLGAIAYSRDFVGDYVGNYSRNFTLNFEGNYSRDFAGNYQGNYSRDFIGDYSRNFIGNYAGLQISISPTNIETYTLYVKVG